MKQNICSDFLMAQTTGVHNFTTDQFALALYTQAAAALIDWKTITAYFTDHESQGAGYVAGGFNLIVSPGFPRLSANRQKVLVSFNDIPVTAPALFATRYGLIYNKSKANRPVATLNWGVNYFATVDFGLQWPPNNDNDCLLQWGI